jgi:hypothetical protein
METNGIFSSCAESLVKLMDVDGGDRELWTPGELGAILEHQLSASVEFDLGALGHELRGRILAMATAASPPIETFRDLFTHPHPPLELLELTKQFAKWCRKHPEKPLPEDVVTVLYFLSIIVALVKCGSPISKLDNQALQHGLKWAMAQSWLDRDTQRLFHQGTEIVQNSEAASP